MSMFEFSIGLSMFGLPIAAIILIIGIIVVDIKMKKRYKYFEYLSDRCFKEFGHEKASKMLELCKSLRNIDEVIHVLEQALKLQEENKK